MNLFARNVTWPIRWVDGDIFLTNAREWNLTKNNTKTGRKMLRKLDMSYTMEDGMIKTIAIPVPDGVSWDDKRDTVFDTLCLMVAQLHLRVEKLENERR
jgi:hypothetical protein